MTWAVGATPGVLKRRDRCRTPGVVKAFAELVERLRQDPRWVAPDKRAVWGKAWPDLPNHRHADLPAAWRACWTIRRTDGDEVVTIVFLGTHKDYEEVYGFRKG